MVGGAGTAVGVVGICLNVLSIAVWSSQEMRSTSALYLITVAVLDLLYLVTHTVFVSVELFYFGLTQEWNWYTSYVRPASPVTGGG